MDSPDTVLKLHAFDTFDIKGRGRVYCANVVGEYESSAHLRDAWIDRVAQVTLPDGSTVTGVMRGVELHARGGAFGPKDTAGVLLRAIRPTPSEWADWTAEYDREKLAELRAATPTGQCMVRTCTAQVEGEGSWWCREHAAVRERLQEVDALQEGLNKLTESTDQEELPLIGFCVGVLHVSPVMGGTAEVLLRVSPEAAAVFEQYDDGDRPMNLLLGTDET